VGRLADAVTWTGRFGALGLAAGATLLDRQQRAELTLRSRILSTASGRVEYEVTGSGPDVLILHGAGGGFDQGTWTARVLGLRGHRIISISRPGYLRTPDLGTLDEAVELVRAALDALDVQQATVIAASGGGLCGYALAMRHPERLRALVMLSAVSGHLVDSGLQLAWYLVRSGADINPTILSALRTSVGRGIVAELARTLAAPEQRIAGVRRDLALSRSAPAPTGISVPTLVIHGTSDGCVPFAHARRTIAGCLNGELVTIAGGGHLCLMTHPEVGERVRAFAE